MKRLLLIAFITLSINAIAQTNTFPTSGNVGIGTSTPLSNLEVANSSGAVLSISTNRFNGTVGSPLRPTIDFLGYANGNKVRISATEQTSHTHGSKLSILVNDGGSPTSLVERLTINMNGNVGIGTTNPQYKLDVNGELKVGRIQLVAYSPVLFSAGDINHGIRYAGLYSNFANAILDGPVMYGYSGGALGVKQGTTETIALRWTGGGNVGIGTATPSYKLDVIGTIRAKEVLVNLDGGADFVFEKDYKLPSIEHVASYVQENKHLPDVPSAKEMVKNGLNMGDMQVKLLQKVEELTLYAIQQNKKIETLMKRIDELEAK